MCLLSNLFTQFQNARFPPTELGHMHFPCTGHFGDYRPEKYRAALTDLAQGNYTLCRPGHVPASLDGWGCMIRVNVRTDKHLRVQLEEVKCKARDHLEYLLQHALDYQRRMSVVFAEEPVDGNIVITSPVLAGPRCLREC
ncbi:uncharacterized protein LDX57_006332 [Aspergillus melleus]|uniref:uncharacterized protein n=1 Tax=Aspergillus melleus TaxID=138277 RepID=UPI001E8E2EAD|nr:uncharacterized protein LDX57_006332 [Aspergillus melleus]KAH8428641.1 hypothetical protein LDX57_006332 [Aspergillus melleus]